VWHAGEVLVCAGKLMKRDPVDYNTCLRRRCHFSSDPEAVRDAAL